MNTGEKELDYDKLCADPAYRADVEAAHAAGLRIEARRPKSVVSSFHDWHSNPDPRCRWNDGWQYRIAPGQQWPIPTEQPERKAREWLAVETRFCGPGLYELYEHPSKPVVDGWEPRSFRVREVLPGDDVEKLRAEVAELKETCGRLQWNCRQLGETLKGAQDREGKTYDAYDKQCKEVADLKRQLAEANAACETAVTAMVKAGEERDAALIELGRKQIGKKLTARAADVVPECGPLPQSVFDGAPEAVEWAVVSVLGSVLWSCFEPNRGSVVWCGSFIPSGKPFDPTDWVESKTRRHRA